MYIYIYIYTVYTYTYVMHMLVCIYSMYTHFMCIFTLIHVFMFVHEYCKICILCIQPASYKATKKSAKLGRSRERDELIDHYNLSVM